MGGTRGAGTAYPSGHYMSSPIFIEVSVARSLVFGVEYCILLIVLFLLVIVDITELLQ
jgi:hypothetical protein